jgi:hypothetical protein
MGHLEIRSKNVIYILETLFDIFSGLAIGYAHRSRVWVIGCLEALVCLEEKGRRSMGIRSCYVMFHRELMLEYVGSWEIWRIWARNWKASTPHESSPTESQDSKWPLFGEFSTDYFWSWWGQMQWQHSSCWPNVLACFFDWFVDLICF